MNKKRVKILLVDDQPANLDEELVRALLDDTFAVVLPDVRMPTLNGVETAALMRRHPRSQQLPIIFLSAAACALEDACALGAVDYVTKPFNPVAVSDSGVGIPAVSLATVFDVVTQVRSDIDRAQGGLGHGSTFTLRLPLGASAAPAIADRRDVGAAAGASGLRVLVVDDNTDAAESLSALLAMLGHQPRVASDGTAGFDLARDCRPGLISVEALERALRAVAGAKK